MGSATKEPLVPPRDPLGLPLKSHYERVWLPVWLFTLLMNLVLLGLGQAAAWRGLIGGRLVSPGPASGMSLGTEAVDMKLYFMAQHQLGWLYLAVVALKSGLTLLNTVAAVWRKEARVNVPDQHVYKSFTPSTTPMPYVLLELDGSLGCFNRAQRAAQNYIEYLPGMVGYVVLAGIVFPLPVFGCTAVYAGARILMAAQYTRSTRRRVAGFLLSNVAAAVVEGLVLLCAILSLVRQG